MQVICLVCPIVSSLKIPSNQSYHFCLIKCKLTLSIIESEVEFSSCQFNLPDSFNNLKEFKHVVENESWEFRLFKERVLMVEQQIRRARQQMINRRGNMHALGRGRLVGAQPRGALEAERGKQIPGTSPAQTDVGKCTRNPTRPRCWMAI